MDITSKGVSTAQIDFVRDFTRFPGGRKKSDGQFSGEEFRDDVLKPALAQSSTVTLNLDGAVGFPFSFIDEVFRKLGEEVGFEVLQKRLIINLNDDPISLQKIRESLRQSS